MVKLPLELHHPDDPVALRMATRAVNELRDAGSSRGGLRREWSGVTDAGRGVRAATDAADIDLLLILQDSTRA
jgi:hypothetical protein